MLEIPDPFIAGNVFHVDPVRVIQRCKDIYEKRKKDHGECPHCPQLRELVNADIYQAIDFAERAKPWSKPLGGPTDTQPIAIVNEDEVGFAMD